MWIQKHAPRPNIRTSPPHPSNLFPPKMPSLFQHYLENNRPTLLKVTDPRSELGIYYIKAADNRGHAFKDQHN
jgi:hypothetical protein